MTLVHRRLEPLYLDHQASTPLDARVLEAMLPWLSRPGNPHSSTHTAGRAARDAVEEARGWVGALVGGRPEGVVFTSGATEAADIALRGTLAGSGAHIVATTIEHACVGETLAALSGAGVRTTMVGVNGEGLVDLDAISEALEESPDLVTVMAVNNEVGTIQPVADVARLCAAAGVPFHTDAAQAAGRVPLHAERYGISMVGLSAHKLYGPQGIGALWCDRELRARLRPPRVGGGQEGGVRPGTVPVALAVGFGAACAVAIREMEADAADAVRLRDLFLARLTSAVPDVMVNGSLDHRIGSNLNVSFCGVESEPLLDRLPDLCLSNGSACSSGALAPSKVLTAMGLANDVVAGAVRIGFGRATTDHDVTYAAIRIAEEVAALRAVSRTTVSRRARPVVCAMA
ncbi:cysteine desulfurase family protein [Methylorubrum thiocyanatum]